MAWNRGARWVASYLALVDGLAASRARISELLSPNTPCLGNKMRCMPLSTKSLLPPRGPAVSALSPLGPTVPPAPAPCAQEAQPGHPDPASPSRLLGRGGVLGRAGVPEEWGGSWGCRRSCPSLPPPPHSPASPLDLAGLHRPRAKPFGPGDRLVTPLEK